MIRIFTFVICFTLQFNHIIAQNFTDVATAIGVNNYFGSPSGGTSGGVSFVDFNKDGYPDLTFGTDQGRQILFYQSNSGNSFTQVFFAIPDISRQNQILWVDIDNDNDYDLYVSNEDNPNKLYQNNGAFNFIDISATCGIDQSNDNTFGAIFGDVDNDGFLDLFISNRANSHSKLYRNNGNNTFSDVTITSGINPNNSRNVCAAFFDFDKDGDLDIHQSNSRGVNKNYLYRNDGNFYFTDISASSGSNIGVDAMSTCIADINNNGLLDVYITNTPITQISNGNDIDGNVLLKNNYPQGFQNIQATSVTALSYISWGGSFADYDNDGWQDIYVANSGANAIERRNHLYFNNGDETFTLQSAINMPGDTKKSFSCATSDFNGDGSMDIVVSNTESAPFQVWRNNITNTNNFIKIDLDGTTSNKDGIGSWIEVFAGSDTYTRYTHCGIGYLSQEGQDNHIGIGTHTVVDSIKIRWSSGIVDKIVNPIINQKTIITEGSNQIDFIMPGGLNPTNNVTNPMYSVARNWMELLLESIRHDFARPTVHARNLFHCSVAMYDMWAAYQNVSKPFFLGRTLDGYTCNYLGIPPSTNVNANGINIDSEEAISFAMYRLLRHRFQNSPAAGLMFPQYIQYMTDRGYNINDVSVNYTTGNPAALGNYIAQEIINFGLQDGSNEQIDYGNLFYQPVNDSLVMDFSGNPNLSDFNRWQPLTLDVFVDQSGNQIPVNTPDFLSPEWGKVTPFALLPNELTPNRRNGNTYEVYCDPGAPPYINTNSGGGNSNYYQWGFSLVSIWSSHLDANDNTMWDISPASIGNIQSYPTVFADYPNFYDYINGGDVSPGHSINPQTGQPYATQLVKRADYARVLAEFWADGPDSETPPGHWFTLLNYVSDHPSFQKRYKGTGTILNDLEWDIKAYFSLGGPMHDAAVAAWGVKGWYDYLRPVSAIRGMAELGQSSNPSLPSYHPGGLPLVPGYIELVSPGDPLAIVLTNLNKIKVRAWKGPNYINDPDTDEAGVDWILAEDWWPYQRPSFVTPPFAGYVSGHSTFSRAAAEVMTMLTGDAFFPDGMGQFSAIKNQFLVFEEGPSDDIILQWATYRDASDQCSLSRIWGGIHPPVDDIPGRLMGEKIGVGGFNLAEKYINGSICLNGTIIEDRVPIPNPHYIGDQILSEGAVRKSNVIFDAANQIILEPGFEVGNGATFIGQIIGCPQ